MIKKILFVFIALLGGALSLRCSGSGTPPNILLLPQFLALDAANSRLFVVDSANNGFSLIDTTNNGIVTGNPLLNSGNILVLPQLPQDIAAMNLGNGVGRIFIIGNSAASFQHHDGS
jgi:DNA-binding beta-propeller fold protein YncE